MKQKRTAPLLAVLLVLVPAAFLHAEPEADLQFREHHFEKTFYPDGSTETEPRSAEGPLEEFPDSETAAMWEIQDSMRINTRAVPTAYKTPHSAFMMLKTHSL